MDTSDKAMLGGWIGGSLDRLVRGRVDSELSARVDWARPAGRATSVTIVKWRVQSAQGDALTGWLDAAPASLPAPRRLAAGATTQ